MGLVKQTPQQLVKRCSQDLSFQSVRASAQELCLSRVSTTTATISQTMFARSVFPECQGSDPALDLSFQSATIDEVFFFEAGGPMGRQIVGTRLGVHRRTNGPSLSVRQFTLLPRTSGCPIGPAKDGHATIGGPKCRQPPQSLIGQTTFATSIGLVKPTSHSLVKRCLQALSFQSVGNHRYHSLVGRRLSPA